MYDIVFFGVLDRHRVITIEIQPIKIMYIKHNHNINIRYEQIYQVYPRTPIF